VKVVVYNRSFAFREPALPMNVSRCAGDNNTPRAKRQTRKHGDVTSREHSATDRTLPVHTIGTQHIQCRDEQR
jgi:hypothetical protein